MKARKAHVSRDVFAVVVMLLVLMMVLSDAVLVIAVHGPSPQQVKQQIDREIRNDQAQRDAQLCAGTYLTVRLRHIYDCANPPPSTPPVRRRPSPAPTSTRTVMVPGPATVTPGPTVTRTLTRPAQTVTATPTCRGVRVNGGCVPTRVPSPLPSLPLH